MRKRIIALLLALILTVGLLPTVALAAEGENPTTDSGSVTKEASKDNLNLVKTVTKEGDNYKVTLESWATGTVTTTTETKPLDIVLLLDVSGSMDEKYSNETIEKFVPYDYRYINFLLGYETTNSDLNDYQDTRYGVWYKLPNSETYVSVKVEKEWKLFADDDYTYSYEQNGSTIIIEKTSNGNKPPKTQFYYKESANTTKLDALKTAVSAFIDNVATNSPNSNISIVKFADDSYKNAEGNDTFWQGDYEYNYTQIVKKLTKVNTAGVTALKKAISELRAGGATASDYGLNKAQEALKDAKQERVVILFTDGEPNYHSGFDKEVATNAVNKAKELKTAATKTTIYTVGVFKNLSENVNLYMSSVSSNYPNASAAHKNGNWKVTDGGSDFGKYYMNATNPVDLLKAFQTISSEVSGGELGAEAVLTDVIAPNFALVAPEGTTGVTAYTVDKTADGWSTQKTTLTNGVTVGTDGQVNVTGFDYSENCVTTTAKPNTTDDYGKKLVVEFTIHHNNYGGTQPTNAGASIKDKAGKEVIKVDDPTVPVTIDEPRITGASETKIYDGKGIDVIANIKAAADALVTGTNKGKNQFVTITVAVKVDKDTTYTYTIPAGAESGSWDPTTPTLTTGKDVGEYKYDLTITYTDATPKTDTTTPAETKTASEKATYTINKRPVTLTSETASKSYDGTPLTKPNVTVADYNDGKNVFNSEFTAAATGTITEPGGPVTNTITVTSKNGAQESNYEITKQEGTLTITKGDPTATEFSLTGKFQKTLNSNTADVPSKSFELTITGTSDNTDKTAISGTADIGTLAKQGDKYTGSAYFGFSSALKFSTDGTYKYKVQETNGSVAGMTYDTTEYTLTVVVADNAGALEITSAIVTKPGTSDTPVEVANLKTSFLTIENTFTAATLPLDPDPATGTVKIVKHLTGDTTTQTFTATITEKNGKIASTTGTAKDVTTNTDVSFTNFGTLVFNAVGLYTFTIEEVVPTNKVPGMTYDKTKHTMVVNVAEIESTKELYISSVTIDDNDINFTATTPWVTFTNKYKTPSTGTVTKKTIRSDMYDGMDKDIWATLFGDKGAFISTSDTIVVDKNTNEVTLAYEVSIVGEATATAKVEDDGAEYVTYDSTVDGVNVNYDENTKIATVTFTKAATAKLYYVKTFTRENGEFATAKNFVTVNDGEPVPSDETTITDKDPGSFDFSEIIRKELKLTGSKSFTGAEFEATLTLKDFKQEVLFNSMLTAYAAEHVEAWPKGWSRTLVAKFDSTAVDGSTTNFLTTDGNHLFLDFPAAGTYKFELQETNKTRTNVTYDDTVYTIVVKVTTDKEHKNYDKLVVTGIGVEYVDKDGNKVTEDIYIGGEAIGKVMTFVNTVDTGKDDYYPIIIPTIIGKDTGMLNKTDHFAYVIGYPDGTVHPNGQITRAEVATIFFRLLRDEVRDGAFTTSNTYSDVAYGKWYNNPISTMSALGIITGYPDGTFKPNKPITRAEFAAIAARFDETQSGKSATFSDVIGHWAAKEIGIAYYNDWIKGYPDGTFKPDQNITRAEAMTLINRVLERKPESPADLLTNMNKWTDNLDTSKWYYLDVQEATNSHGYTRKTFNYELWRQMLPDPDWSRYER